MKYLLFCFLLSAQTMLAQWSLGVSVTPMASLPFTGDSYITPKGGAAYKLSLNAVYAISSRLSVSSGVQYSIKTVIWEEIVKPDYFLRRTERYHSLELPLRCNYLIASMGESSIGICAGVFAGLSYERAHEIRESDWSGGWKDVQGEFVGGAMAGFEYRYQCTKYLWVSLSPYYMYERYATEQYVLDSVLPLAFHSFGVDGGIFLRLN